MKINLIALDFYNFSRRSPEQSPLTSCYFQIHHQISIFPSWQIIRCHPQSMFAVLEDNLLLTTL